MCTAKKNVVSILYLPKDVLYVTVISDSYIALKYELKIWKNYHTKYDAEDPLQSVLLD